MEENQDKESGLDGVKKEAKEFVGDLASTAAGAASEKLASAASPLSHAVFIIRVVLFLLAAVGVYIAGVKFNFFPDYFTPKPVTIANTPLVVTGVKKISQLMASSSTIEVVVDSTVMEETSMSKVGGFFGGLFSSGKPKPRSKTMKKVKEIVFIARGKVFSGFDMSNLDEKSITIQDTSIRVVLNEPKILDVVVNPMDFELFAEDGEWNSEEIRGVKNKAKDQIRRRAIELGILERSKASGIKSMESFYRTMGFRRVEIVISSTK